MTTPATTANREVDTTLPEFSWIPFFRELAVRLSNDGWEDRQPDIVAELQRMDASGLKVPDYVNKLDRIIDPFSVISILARDIRPEFRSQLAHAYREFFGIRSACPPESPLVPNTNFQGAFYFDKSNVAECVCHWETLKRAVNFSGDGALDQSSFESALDTSVEVQRVGASTLSTALYWADPTKYLPVAVIFKAEIEAAALDVALEPVGISWGVGFGPEYLLALRRVQEWDSRPFPTLDLEFRLADLLRKKNHRKRVKYWYVPAQQGRESGFGPISDRFGLDDTNLSDAQEVESAIHDANSDLDEETRLHVVEFVQGISRGDVILAPTDDGLRYGFAASDQTYFSDGSEFPEKGRNRRNVLWRPEVLDPEDLSLSISDEMMQIPDGRATILPAILRAEGYQTENGPVQAPCPWSPVFLEPDEVSRMLRLLRAKRQIVLQGPPGVGKTYIARKLARTLVSEAGHTSAPCEECGLKHGDVAHFEDADESIGSVQFHQSYSYEDFVGGYRPSTNDAHQLVFEASDGAFLRLCEEARSEANRRYVMLIDEVNRGNLSRVFGELMMLLEADKRNDANAVELQHRKAMADMDDEVEFFVPDNVYIIGTMNLADRSLTGMNVAMRRRFAFFELEPQFANAKFARLAQARGMPPKMLERIVEQLPALNEAIATDYALGSQYSVGHSFFVPTASEPADWEEENWQKWYDEIIEFEIRPLLEEYWFDEPAKVAEQVGKLRRRDGLSDESA